MSVRREPELYVSFVRHAKHDHHANLTPESWEEARRKGEEFKAAYPGLPTKIYTSPRPRALQTALAIVKGLNPELEVPFYGQPVAGIKERPEQRLEFPPELKIFLNSQHIRTRDELDIYPKGEDEVPIEERKRLAFELPKRFYRQLAARGGALQPSS